MKPCDKWGMMMVLSIHPLKIETCMHNVTYKMAALALVLSSSADSSKFAS